MMNKELLPIRMRLGMKARPDGRTLVDPTVYFGIEDPVNVVIRHVQNNIILNMRSSLRE